MAQVQVYNQEGKKTSKLELADSVFALSLIHISEPTRQAEISYAVFCLKKKKKHNLVYRLPLIHLRNHQ